MFFLFTHFHLLQNHKSSKTFYCRILKNPIFLSLKLSTKHSWAKEIRYFSKQRPRPLVGVKITFVTCNSTKRIIQHPLATWNLIFLTYEGPRFCTRVVNTNSWNTFWYPSKLFGILKTKLAIIYAYLRETNLKFKKNPKHISFQTERENRYAMNWFFCINILIWRDVVQNYLELRTYC